MHKHPGLVREDNTTVRSIYPPESLLICKRNGDVRYKLAPLLVSRPTSKRQVALIV